VTGLLASAESLWIGVQTAWGRMLEYPTLLIGEEEGSISLHLPAELAAELSEGQTVVVKASLPGSFLLAETEILAVQRKPFAHLVLVAPSPARTRRVPRRQYFRVSAVLPVTFSFERPDAHVPERLVTVVANTFDISSGGVGIIVNRHREPVLPVPLTEGRLEVTLAMIGDPGPRPALACGAKISRIEEVRGTSNVRLGAHYRGISEQQRSEVARFVIGHQLALRRRGVLV
jgi:c-di-GMP-binding flagellar brake protein YcgR